MSLSDGHNRVSYNLKYIMYFDTIRERLRCREFFEGVNKILKKGGWWVTNNGGGGIDTSTNYETYALLTAEFFTFDRSLLFTKADTFSSFMTTKCFWW